MSVAFDRKSGEVGGDSWNLMGGDNTSKYGWRYQISVWWIGAAAGCLGFLLLTVILGLVAHNSRAIGHGDKKFENLIEVGKMTYENLIYNLTKDRDVLRDERDQLRINSSTLTKEMEVLQSQYDTVAASRDKLQEEVDRLNHNSTGKTCHSGWIKFNNKCYYLSPNGVSKTWEDSRKDCQTRRSDLVIITTRAELDFVTRRSGVTWIGLSDKEQEGQWKWVDGTDLEGPGFWQEGEPNDHEGKENCVEASRDSRKWNDVPCDRRFLWVCED